MLFRVSVCDFLRACAVERQLSVHTVRAYSNDLADFLKFLIANAVAHGNATATPATPNDATTPASAADLAAATVMPATLNRYLEDMLGRRKLAATTVRRRFACLRAFFRHRAEAEGFDDPMAALKLQLPRRKRLPRTLSRPEVSSLMTSLTMFTSARSENDAVLATAVSLMVATGIRVGELCRLGVDEVSPDGATCRIHGKGSRDRVVYIGDPTLRAALKKMVALRRAQGGLSDDERHGGHTALFRNRQGLAMKPQSIRSRLRRYARQIGLSRRVTPHMLRHTAATLLIETGVDIRFVQRLLGHSSIATTEIYTHVSDEALRTTLERANILATLGRGGGRGRPMSRPG